MDIQARKDELEAQQQALIQQQQETGINIQRLAGAIAILGEQLEAEADAEEPVAEPSKNGKVKEKIEA